MRVVQMSRFGGPEVLDIVEAAVPMPGKGEVLVRVRAAGVNFADTLMRQNKYALTPPLPSVLGHEVAGTVERLGDGVDNILRGARVAAPLFGAGVWFGGYSEYVLIDADFVTPLPDELSFETAAALMVQGLTALYLTKRVNLQGKTVLVNAAAGGVGTLLVQLAKRAGAKSVIAAASTKLKLDLARSVGADIGINYTNRNWNEELLVATGGNGPDVIYESVGGSVTTTSLETLAPLGEIFIYGALNIQSFQLGIPELLRLIFKNQSITGFALAPLLSAATLRSGLLELFDLAVTGQLKITIGGSYPLEQATEAHRNLEERRTTGKIVLAA